MSKEKITENRWGKRTLGFAAPVLGAVIGLASGNLIEDYLREHFQRSEASQETQTAQVEEAPVIRKIEIARFKPSQIRETRLPKNAETIYSEDNGEYAITIRKGENKSYFTRFIRKRDNKSIWLVDYDFGCWPSGDINEKDFYEYAKKRKEELYKWHIINRGGKNLEQCVSALEQIEPNFSRARDSERFWNIFRHNYNPENSVVIYLFGKEVMQTAIAQKELEDFYSMGIKPTGKVDEKTRNAVKRFQKEFQIPVTGELFDRYGRNEFAGDDGKPWRVSTVNTIDTYWDRRFKDRKGYGVDNIEDEQVRTKLEEFRAALRGELPAKQVNQSRKQPGNYKTDDLRKDDELTLLARMIFGEARGCLNTDGVAVGYTAINRANDGKKWNGETVKEAILKPWQYSCFNKNDPNREKVMDLEAYDAGAWGKCLEIAELILSGKIKDPVGATHYHTRNVKPEWANDARMRRLGERKGHAYYREM